MLYVIKNRPVAAYPMMESISKVTVSPKTPKLFKMLANYNLKSKLVVKKK